MVLIAPLDAAEPAPVSAATEERTAPRAGTPLARGKASWYGPRFHGRRTANGERYDMHALTAAHRTLPFGTKLRVRSVHTGKEVVVRINDRGPYKHQRIIDLSRAAMVALGTLERGVTEVELLRE
jgi:rare lipoprotein A